MSVDSGRRIWLAAAAALSFGGVTALALPRPKERVIKIVAKKFEFVPNEIQVRNGETVILQLSAPEVPMGFNLADFGMRTDIMPGKGATLRFTPDKAGSFTFLCDVFCGSGHEDMSGTLIVSE